MYASVPSSSSLWCSRSAFPLPSCLHGFLRSVSCSLSLPLPWPPISRAGVGDAMSTVREVQRRRSREVREGRNLQDQTLSVSDVPQYVHQSSVQAGFQYVEESSRWFVRSWHGIEFLSTFQLGSKLPRTLIMKSVRRS